MSKAIPFLRRPSVLTGELAGDVGFDPLGLAKNEETLWAYREAEIKHGRLAMLAAAGWPVSELLDRQLADYLGAPSVLVEGDRVPSVLNGGLENVVPEWWGFCLGMCAAIDLYGVQKARAAGRDSGYIPGDVDSILFTFVSHGRGWKKEDAACRNQTRSCSNAWRDWLCCARVCFQAWCHR